MEVYVIFKVIFKCDFDGFWDWYCCFVGGKGEGDCFGIGVKGYIFGYFGVGIVVDDNCLIIYS